ncbi:MAG: OmpP1/FadL family transporter [Waddliaceae bacterium]
MSKRISLLLAITALLGYHQAADAAGFALIEQSVSSMGNAYAGGAAVAEDASTIYFNPAGMTRICNYEFVTGGHIVISKSKFDNDGSIHASFTDAAKTTHNSLTGSNGHDAGESALVPHTYFVKNFCNNNFAVGLGINSPFGLATDYGHHWKGRYHAIRSQILTININPALAYRVNRCWSIGAGLNVMYLHAKLSNAVDYGLLVDQAIALGAGDPTYPFPHGIFSQALDGRAIVKGNSWGYGGNIGVLWEPCCGTRFGAHFRSEIKHRVKGSEKFKDTPGIEAAITPIVRAPSAAVIAAGIAAKLNNTRAKSDVTLPSSFSVSGYHELNDCWAVMGDITWTKWNVLERLRFRFNNSLQPDSITVMKWQNNMRYSGGVTYSPWNCWTFRTGLAYDQTPIKNKKYRTPRLPGEDRFWTALGVGYKWSNCIRFDLGYAHLFIKEPKIDKTHFLTDDITRGGLKGDYDARTDIVSAQLVWDF